MRESAGERRVVCGWLGLLAMVSLAVWVGVAGAQVAGPELHQALGASQRVRVVIALRPPVTPPTDRLAKVRGIRAIQDRVLSRLSAADLRLTHRWEAIHALAGELTRAGLAKLLADPDVVRVDLDVDGGAELLQSVPLINANDVQAWGCTGHDVTVAVLDSGVDGTHPDLSDDLVAEHCFCTDSTGAGCCPNGSTEQAGAGSARDDNGHGTNVTGIITSNGTVAAKGVAPSAKIVAVRVLDSQSRFAATAQVVSGLNWIIQNRPDVRVINMSLATSMLFAGTCDNAYAWTMAFAEAINTLKSNGVNVFAASANNGSTTQLAAPACVASAVSVGAVYDSNVGGVSFSVCTDATTAADKVTCFSNSNATLDLLAPGAPITSTGRGGGTSTYYGTSQATPHAAGAAAVLLGAQGALTPDQVEARLKTTGVSILDTRNALWFPRVDLLAAIQGGAASVGVFRPSDGTFYLDANGSGTWDGCGTDQCLHIGMTGDIPLVGDWNGSGSSKVGLFRPSDGTFYLDYNGNGVWDGCGTDRCLQIGLNGDIPLVGDWNGSGTSKVGAFRPGDGTFYLDYNGSGTWEGCGTDRCLQIGMLNDIPLVGDWSGTGFSKVGVFRPTDGTFYLDYNGSGTWDGCGTDRCLQIGMVNDKPLVGDWDGSGSSKVGVFRPSDGTFYLDHNGSGTWDGCGTDRCLQIGLSGDTPLVGKW